MDNESAEPESREPRPSQPSSPTREDDLELNTEFPTDTGIAPSLPTLAGAPKHRAAGPPDRLAPGDHLGDFEIRGILGQGAFGAVYLAWQHSLERLVALKVTANVGSEGRTMARLEHANIVQVFSESVDSAGTRRLLCMQFVPGTTLEAIIRRLREDPTAWDGQRILRVIDELNHNPAGLDPTALRERQLLEHSDRIEVSCWMGARLADALAYAHGRDRTLHRDIKPGNVLVSQYGRPLLVDFNLALRTAGDSGAGDQLFGGTLAYMSPEHLDAFNPATGVTEESVDESSDMYSLGLVIYELLAGHLPFDAPPPAGSSADMQRALAEMATQRREAKLAPPEQIPETVYHTLARCLHAEPSSRFSAASELSQAFEGCREHRVVERRVAPRTALFGYFARHPFLWLVLLTLLPHGVGSVVNVSYNQLRIVDRLTDTQQATFIRLVIAYNLIVYPCCVYLAVRALLPIYRVWKRHNQLLPQSPEAVSDARRRALRYAGVVTGLACLGWFPGDVLFPTLLAPPPEIDWTLYVRFLVSFTISGLIALTYSLLGVQFIVVGVFYPKLWADLRGFRSAARSELTPLQKRLWIARALSGSIPLAAACLMVAIGPEQFNESQYVPFRILVTALIALRMAGFQLAVYVTGTLEKTIDQYHA